MPQLGRTSTPSMSLTALSSLVILSVTPFTGANIVTKVEGATDNVGLSATSIDGSNLIIRATAARTRGDNSSLFVLANVVSDGPFTVQYGIDISSETNLDQLFTIQAQAQKFKLLATLQNLDFTPTAPPSLVVSADLSWDCFAGQSDRNCGSQTIFSILGTTMNHRHGKGDDCFPAVVSGPVFLNGVPYTVVPRTFCFRQYETKFHDNSAPW